MAYIEDDITLNCQNCDTVVRKLTAGEQKMVAANPYNFIVFCTKCQLDEKTSILVESEGMSWDSARELAKVLDF